MAERDLTFKQRIAVALAVWLILGPLTVGFFLWAWWLGLIVLLVGAWTTWDYIRRGDMAGHVTEGMSKSAFVAKGAEELFRHEDD